MLRNVKGNFIYKCKLTSKIFFKRGLPFFTTSFSVSGTFSAFWLFRPLRLESPMLVIIPDYSSQLNTESEEASLFPKSSRISWSVAEDPMSATPALHPWHKTCHCLLQWRSFFFVLTYPRSKNILTLSSRLFILRQYREFPDIGDVEKLS